MLQDSFDTENLPLLVSFSSPRKSATHCISCHTGTHFQSFGRLTLQERMKVVSSPPPPGGGGGTRPKVLNRARLLGHVTHCMQDKDKAAKEAVLLALCSRGFQKGRAIIFFSTKKQAHRAKILFGLAEIATSAELHGDMTQTARLESLDSFRKVEHPPPPPHQFIQELILYGRPLQLSSKWRLMYHRSNFHPFAQLFWFSGSAAMPCLVVASFTYHKILKHSKMPEAFECGLHKFTRQPAALISDRTPPPTPPLQVYRP